MGQQRQVITEHIEERGANEPSQHFLDHCLFTYKACVLHHSRLFPVPIPRNTFTASAGHLQGARAEEKRRVGQDILLVVLSCR